MTIVKFVITFEFRLRPNQAQETALWSALHGTRELYNAALRELIEHYEKTGTYLGFFAHDKLHGKAQHPDLPAVLVDTTLKRLHGAFSSFFRRCNEGCAKKGFPRFKSARRWRSIQFRDAASNGISGNYFKAGKILGGRIRFNLHRKIEGALKFCRILRKPSGWYLQAVCDAVFEAMLPTGKSVGLDFGLKTLVSDSDGNKVENPTFLKRSLRKLRVAQRRIARRQKGSNRRRKACQLAARIHERISNQRRDYLHKVARDYVNRYDVIALEDLDVCSMMSRLFSRSISDASWSILRQLIEAKAASAGRKVVAVPAQYTSQKCSDCGEIVQKALSVRTHVCPHCGYIDCRDINAAKNILAKAVAV